MWGVETTTTTFRDEKKRRCREMNKSSDIGARGGVRMSQEQPPFDLPGPVLPEIQQPPEPDGLEDTQRAHPSPRNLQNPVPS